jgi:predicted alpha/beta-fold hydrolase
MIVPGVTGSTKTPYVKEMCNEALMHGYIPVVVNPLVAPEERDYRVLDFSDSEVMKRSIDMINEKLGDDIEIYGVGFSLGANYLLRYLGAN